MLYRAASRENFSAFGVRERWIFALTGFADSQSTLYSLYRGCLLVLNLQVLFMTVYAAYLGSADLNTVIEAVHIAAGVLCTSTGLLSRIATGRSIRKLMEMVRRGIETYEEEPLSLETMKLKMKMEKEIDRKLKFIEIMYFISFLSNMVYFPLCKLFFFPEDLPAYYYLPHLLYFPFDTRTPGGYAAAYAVDFVFFSFLYLTAVNMISIYVFCALKLRTHLRILNASLARLEQRAFALYKKAGLRGHCPQEDRKNFRMCLYRCLRANARHHQALVRFKKESQSFIGIILLITFTLAALIYATVLYLISQEPPLYVLVHLGITNIAEQIYVLYIAVFGEQIIQESHKLYLALYSTSWFDCDENFKQALVIMLNNTRKPLILRATFLEADASMESYGDLLTTMYKLMSIARSWGSISAR